VAFFALLLWYLGPSEIFDLLRRIGWSSIPIFLLYAAHHATRALALYSCVLQRGVVGYGDALAIRLSGEAIQSLTFTGPLLAEPTRAWLLERRGLTLKEGFAATITEYLICSFVTAGMSVAGLLYLVRRFEPVAVVSAVAVGVACALTLFLVASAIAITRRFYLIAFQSLEPSSHFSEKNHKLNLERVFERVERLEAPAPRAAELSPHRPPSRSHAWPPPP